MWRLMFCRRHLMQRWNYRYSQFSRHQMALLSYTLRALLRWSKNQPSLLAPSNARSTLKLIISLRTSLQWVTWTSLTRCSAATSHSTSRSITSTSRRPSRPQAAQLESTAWHRSLYRCACPRAKDSEWSYPYLRLLSWLGYSTSASSSWSGLWSTKWHSVMPSRTTWSRLPPRLRSTRSIRATCCRIQWRWFLEKSKVTMIKL